MIAKAATGIKFFDERYGGVYRGRSVLVSGRSGTGKTVLGLQFIQQGIRQGERCLLLSTQSSSDLMIYAEELYLPIIGAVNAGNLILLEYHEYVHVQGREKNFLLPPEGFLQLKDIIDTHGIQRIVTDTVLPWVVIQSPETMAEHVFSFVRALDRLNVTSLLTIPKPASRLAYRLKSVLEEVVPISIMLSLNPKTGNNVGTVTKYLGEPKLSPGVNYTIAQGRGICENNGSISVSDPKAESKHKPSNAKAPNRPTFAAAILDKQVLMADFHKAMGKIKTLSGTIPVCANCKRIRNDKGYWEQWEAYISSHSQALFSHGICPECAKSVYGLDLTEREPGENDPATPER